jgi:hypothetical protein
VIVKSATLAKHSIKQTLIFDATSTDKHPLLPSTEDALPAATVKNRSNYLETLAF